MKATHVALVTTLALAMAPALGSQDNKVESKKETKEAKIRKLLDLTGAGDLGKQTMEGMMAAFKNAPGLPEDFIETFLELAKPEDVVNLVVPIYMKHLDEETLDAVIKFHESPAGQKLIKVTPSITKESMEAGQVWGRDLALKTLEILEEKKQRKEEDK